MQDLKTLDLLVCLAKCRSFTEAARQTGMSVAKASKMVSRVEQELGLSLFNRTTRSISPTEQGGILIEKAELVLSLMAEAIERLQRERAEPEGRVRVLMSSPIAKACVIPILPQFLDRYPRIQLELRLYDADPDPIEQGFDIAITDWITTSESCISRNLRTLPIALVASPDYLKKRGVPGVPAELVRHDCINVRMASGKLAEWKFSARGGGRREDRAFAFTPFGNVVVVDQYDGVTEAAMAGLGIAMVYLHSVLPQLIDGTLKLLLPDHEIHPGIVETNRYNIRYRNRKHLPKAQRLFVDYLVEHFRQESKKQLDMRKFSA